MSSQEADSVAPVQETPENPIFIDIQKCIMTELGVQFTIDDIKMIFCKENGELNLWLVNRMLEVFQ